MPKRLTTEQFIDRARKVHGDKYGYKLVDYKNNITKINIICPVHGIFEQRPIHHLNYKGCPECAGNIKKTTEEFINRARKVHGDKYDYSLVQKEGYKNCYTKVGIICPVHGVFEQRPSNHLKSKQGCPKCAGNIKSDTQQFINRARKVHGDKYDYSLVQKEGYKNNSTKVKMICPIHGIFEQRPIHHINRKQGCPKCGNKIRSNKQRKTTEQFIIDAYCKHGDKYNYKFVDYKDAHTKINIICPVHGIFGQRPNDHVSNKNGCPKCAGQYEEQYAKNNIPVYNTYAKQLEPYGIICRRNKEDKNILEVKCMYCDRWYIPLLKSIYSKIDCINGKQSGESNLYCSNECKQACPTYGQKLYPKGYKVNTSREVQPALRKLVLKRDGYTCQKCFATNVELHCHHYEGIEVNPIESADIDNCITLCKICHNEIHKIDKCGIKQYKRKEC